MCGRYVLRLRPAEVRQQLEQSQMPSEEAPDDDQVRSTYNFAPGHNGIVYRPAIPDSGSRKPDEKYENTNNVPASGEVTASQDPKYKLQAMKWGLIPSWMKRKPDYGSMMKTINCRDDSLAENRGLWNSMKHRKRCIVVCQGFYEWLKKNGGKEKIPYFVKRKDGQLMCFAGLWDCVRFEGSEEKLYTYTIITTDSNKQLSFLHDRMPVIFDNGSESLWKWLDPDRTEWNRDLQSLLKPFDGELEYYPVNKEVGKVGNDSPSFIIPVDSKENKNNISNFFDKQRKAANSSGGAKTATQGNPVIDKIGHVKGEARGTSDEDGTEDNAPLPTLPGNEDKRGIKREHEDADGKGETPGSPPLQKAAKTGQASVSPDKSKATKAGRKTRSATSNGSTQKASPATAGDGSRKITAFFGK
ncbi:putative peptidase [Lasiodiplodia theobromae]|uniref:Putative peptidase n=1 Tax=Lasiodiplodia theobromae TaxID=45133 RepID=A0A5N5CVK1_9PEZI|nr:putative peptidase [Lasiodiplodia theobromae]